jgi:hypothetical protein
MTIGERFLHPVFVGDIDQSKGAVDVRLDKNSRIFDAVVDVAFGREMDDAADIVRFKERFDKAAIADVPLDENVAFVVFHFGKVFEVPGVGQQVEVDKTDIGIFFEEIGDKVASDKSGASGD